MGWSGEPFQTRLCTLSRTRTDSDGLPRRRVFCRLQVLQRHSRPGLLSDACTHQARSGQREGMRDITATSQPMRVSTCRRLFRMILQLEAPATQDPSVHVSTDSSRSAIVAKSIGGIGSQALRENWGTDTTAARNTGRRNASKYCVHAVLGDKRLAFCYTMSKLPGVPWPADRHSAPCAGTRRVKKVVYANRVGMQCPWSRAHNGKLDRGAQVDRNDFTY